MTNQLDVNALLRRKYVSLNYKIELKQSKNYLYTITRENVFEQIKSKQNYWYPI